MGEYDCPCLLILRPFVLQVPRVFTDQDLSDPDRKGVLMSAGTMLWEELGVGLFSAAPRWCRWSEPSKSPSNLSTWTNHCLETHSQVSLSSDWRPKSLARKSSG